MFKQNKSLIVLAFSLLSVLSCSSTAPNLMTKELEQLQEYEGELLYEDVFTSSSATGACNGTHLHRWYGAEQSFEEIYETLDEEASQNDWAPWPDDDPGIWRKETVNGLFTLALADFSNKPIPPQQYVIPDSAIHSMQNFRTVYFLHIGFMYKSVANECYDR
jgi:hypothetical protein